MRLNHRRATFWFIYVIQILVAHNIAYLAHEYAHSFTAWLLGYKTNPLALHYGDLSAANLIGLLNVNENVDYSSLYAHGHGHAAALIAFAGIGFGNVLLYVVCRLLLRTEWIRTRPPWTFFFFWLCLMNVGNFYDYVPIRTFDTDGDMAHIAQGLHVSPWLILVTVGYLTAWTIWNLFRVVLPRSLQALPADSHSERNVTAALAAYVLFGFYGAAGFFAPGNVSHVLSWISMVMVVPAIAASVRWTMSPSTS